MVDIIALDRAVAAVAPIFGVGTKGDDKSTWQIDFKPEATTAQRAAALRVIAAFDVSAPPPPEPPQIILVAQARLVINGDEIAGVETAVGFGGAMALEPHVFWIFFTQSQLDNDYISFVQARAGATGAFADVTDANADYIEVTVTDRAGAPLVPTNLSLSVQRAQ